MLSSFTAFFCCCFFFFLIFFFFLLINLILYTLLFNHTMTDKTRGQRKKKLWGKSTEKGEREREKRRMGDREKKKKKKQTNKKKKQTIARFSQQNVPNCYSKLALLHFEGGSPVKFAFQGLNITLLGSLQPADMKNNPRQQC